jgi:FdhD protein
LKRYSRPFVQDETGASGILPWRIGRLTDRGDHTIVEGGVVIEEPLEICLDGKPAAVLMRTPGMEKELAAGFCLGEGLVADLMDIALIQHCGRAMPDTAPGDTAEGDPLDESRNRVDVRLMPGAASSPPQSDVAPLIRSGCGRTEVGALVENMSPIGAGAKVRADTLSKLGGQITRRQAAYRAAGGIHAAAVFETDGRTVVVCEDIGRHNAVDKAVGYCLLRGISLQDKVLVSTGRASYEMVTKGVRVGVPILASISSPTSLAVELAEALNCTLLGYLRGRTFNVYTHGWRIVADGINAKERKRA